MAEKQIPVALTREQWQALARLTLAHHAQGELAAKYSGRHPERTIAAHFAKETREINRAICEQAGLGEVFRCE